MTTSRCNLPKALASATGMALALMLIVAATGCGDGAARPVAPAYTKLAFYSNRTVSPATSLFLMDLDGSNVTPVPFSSSVYSPSSSADLKTIAFDASSVYWTSNASGSVQAQVTNAGTGFAIRVSPDGKKLIYNAQVGNNYHLWIANVDGSSPLDLTATMPSGMTDCYTGSFSADSSRIVMTCWSSSLSGVFLIHPDGTGLATVITEGQFVDTPAFTPDGKKILYVSYSLNASPTYGIVSVNPDGSGLAVLVDGAYEMEILNSTLYYTLYDSVAGNNRIYKANLDGTSAVALTDGSTNDSLSLSTD